MTEASERMSDAEIEATLAMLKTGHCKPNHGCNVLTVCACAAMENAADCIVRLRSELSTRPLPEGAVGDEEVREAIERLWLRSTNGKVQNAFSPDEVEQFWGDIRAVLYRVDAIRAMLAAAIQAGGTE